MFTCDELRLIRILAERDLSISLLRAGREAGGMQYAERLTLLLESVIQKLGEQGCDEDSAGGSSTVAQ